VRAISISQHGDADVLESIDIGIPAVSGALVLVKNHAIGVNYVDVQHRQGEPYAVSLPLIPGIEAAGVVEAVGEHVSGFTIGDRVAYAGYMGGNYAEYTLVPEDKLVPVPDGLDLETAAAGLLQGMTAHCLTNDVFYVRPGHLVLVHAAAGGVGSVLVQFAKVQGAIVIGTVSSAQKAAFVRDLGADHIVNYSEQDFSEAVNELTNNVGVHVIYDAVGRVTFDKSLMALRKCGHMVVYGQTSGVVPPFDINRLSGLTSGSTRGSLTLTWAALSHYNEARQTLLSRAATVFDLLRRGAVRVHISHRFPLADASAAHHLLATRGNLGKILLIP
jgi:NADPH:quinone reductase